MTIHNEIYNLDSNKIKHDYTFCEVADLHVTKGFSYKLLDKFLESVSDINPDMIFVPGDLMCNADDMLNLENAKKLREVLNGLSKINDTFISLGNHDIKNGKTLKREDTLKLLKSIEKEGIYVLANELIKCGEVNIVGFSPREDCYYHRHSSEWRDYFIEDFEECDFEVTSSYYNVLLTHSPEIINSLGINLLGYDLILSGHNHNGLVPRWMENVIPNLGTKGVTVSMQNDEIKNATINHSDFCRGMHNTYSGKLIVTRGLRKYVEDYMRLVDKMCSKDITTIKLSRKM